MLNANVLINQSAPQPKTHTVTVNPAGSQVYDLEVNYLQDAPTSLANSFGAAVSGGNAMIRFGWVPRPAR